MDGGERVSVRPLHGIVTYFSVKPGRDTVNLTFLLRPHPPSTYFYQRIKKSTATQSLTCGSHAPTVVGHNGEVYYGGGVSVSVHVYVRAREMFEKGPIEPYTGETDCICKRNKRTSFDLRVQRSCSRGKNESERYLGTEPRRSSQVPRHTNRRRLMSAVQVSVWVL